MIYYYTKTRLNRMDRKHPEVKYAILKDWRAGMTDLELRARYSLTEYTLDYLKDWLVKF